MSQLRAFPNRELRICYWNAFGKVIDSDLMQIEQNLRHLGEVKIEEVKSLDDSSLSPCDLLIVAAQQVSEDDFSSWMTKFRGKIHKQGHVWTPALIFADVPFSILNDIWPEAVKENWYFDILSPAHIESLPIRVANILRIHDHLHELHRYSETLDELNTKVVKAEKEISNIKKSSK